MVDFSICKTAQEHDFKYYLLLLKRNWRSLTLFYGKTIIILSGLTVSLWFCIYLIKFALCNLGKAWKGKALLQTRGKVRGGGGLSPGSPHRVLSFSVPPEIRVACGCFRAGTHSTHSWARRVPRCWVPLQGCKSGLCKRSCLWVLRCIFMPQDVSACSR